MFAPKSRVASRHTPAPRPRRRYRLVLPRHRSTSKHVAAIYPAAVQAPLPTVGPLLGEDLTAGHAPLCWDPFEIYHAGIVTNPNGFIMGEPGFAKSSLIKCWLAWMFALYGLSRWVTITDPKGEYLKLAELYGLSVVRLAPGGGVCVNPLERRDGLSAEERRRERDVQTLMLQALAATHLKRALSQLERKAIRTIVEVMMTPDNTSTATLHDVIGLLASPTGEMCTATKRSGDELVRAVEDVRFAYDEMCTGPLQGMFDGPSTVSVDWDSPGLVLDLSGVINDQAAMPLVMVAAINWSRQQRSKLTGRQIVNINDESYYMYKQAETVEFAQERRKLGRTYGEANIDICHRPSDLGSQADDGSAMSKIAGGLLSDSSMKIIFRQAAPEMEAATMMFRLTDNEQDAVRGLKRGKALWKLADRSLIGRHYRPDELFDITDTDHYMRRETMLSDDEQTEAFTSGSSDDEEPENAA